MFKNLSQPETTTSGGCTPPSACSTVTEPSSQVWAKALEIAKKKLSDNNLPSLDLTNLTSQSAEENIDAVVTALNAAQ